MTSRDPGHGVPPGARTWSAYIKAAFDVLFVCSNPGNPDAAHRFWPQDAHSCAVTCRSCQGFSSEGAVLGGNKDSKVVPWLLLLLFRTSLRDFKLQPQWTLLFGDAWQRQLCSRWTRIFSYGMCTAAGRGHVPRG